MDSREFKDFVYGEFARIGKTLSSPKRIELLDLLTQGPKSVELLALETKMGTANTSKHLQALLDAELVSFSKEKNYVIYELAGDEVMQLVLALRRTAEERIADINIVRNDFILKNNDFDSIRLKDLAEKIKEGSLTLLDVRPIDEYAADHLPSAVSMPLSEIETRLDSLPKDKEVVAYCRGPYCVYATEAVELLRARGYRASLLEAGVNEWKQMEG
ncbi:ArsR family transcriptional regulator [Planococcus salinarum]|uniref:ArsR family transcriptional regulator n=1 Tax=Planococcus salinarum TaxID=622695 RepID=A0ABX3D1U5_9BACL|nr:metalloregulator ArsR/SmtB family transcription factor [Planococcus salinarum]OHX56376.1 ArsR family transcriptional regulator [Planococcus salinarum]TAA72435.1 metalloregulator ArsR/SmtB family transcription factor [Planococcus salinarum]